MRFVSSNEGHTNTPLMHLRDVCDTHCSECSMISICYWEVNAQWTAAAVTVTVTVAQTLTSMSHVSLKTIILEGEIFSGKWLAPVLYVLQTAQSSRQLSTLFPMLGKYFLPPLSLQQYTHWRNQMFSRTIRFFIITLWSTQLFFGKVISGQKTKTSAGRYNVNAWYDPWLFHLPRTKTSLKASCLNNMIFIYTN